MKKIKLNNEEHFQMPYGINYSETYIRLASHRILFISEDITDKMAAEVSAMLLYLDNQDNSENIEMYIHSNGGAISGLLNIYDVMQMIKSPITTICTGKCYSAGAVLLAAGTKGSRYAFKNSNVMIHGIQCSFPIPGHDMTNSKNYYKYLEENNDNIMKILGKHTNHTLSKIREDCKQDTWMNAKQALDYGIIDEII